MTSTETRPITDFTSGLDQPQFFSEIKADVTITTTVNAVILVDLTTVDMIFASALSGTEVDALNALITAHVPTQSGFPAYLPTPNISSSLTGSSSFTWQNTGGTNILVLNGDTINVEQPLELLRVTASQIPAVSDANHSILYVDDTTGLLTQVEFGGASGPVRSSGASTGVGAPIFYGESSGVLYFNSFSGSNAHTQVVENAGTVEITVPFGTTSTTGAVRFATPAETAAGNVDGLAVSPTGLATYVAANAGGGTTTELSSTGVGANVFKAKVGNTGYFRSITGTNAHTQVVQNVNDISLTVPFASTTSTGAIRIATQAEVDSGNLGNVAISPTGLANWVLGDLAIPRYEIEFTDVISNFSSTTDVVMSGPMAITNPDAGTYLVSFSFSAAASTNNNSLFISIYVGGVQNAASERESANNKPVIAATQAIISVNGSQDIDIRWRVSANAASSPGPRILSALRIAP